MGLLNADCSLYDFRFDLGINYSKIVIDYGWLIEW